MFCTNSAQLHELHTFRDRADSRLPDNPSRKEKESRKSDNTIHGTSTSQETSYTVLLYHESQCCRLPVQTRRSGSSVAPSIYGVSFTHESCPAASTHRRFLLNPPGVSLASRSRLRSCPPSDGSNALCGGWRPFQPRKFYQFASSDCHAEDCRSHRRDLSRKHEDIYLGESCRSMTRKR